MKFENIDWKPSTWLMRDGTRVPFETSDITELLREGGYDDPEEWDRPELRVIITRWPRKVTFDAHVSEGYTDQIIRAHVHRLLETDRSDLLFEFDDIMEQVDKLAEAYAANPEPGDVTARSRWQHKDRWEELWIEECDTF